MSRPSSLVAPGKWEPSRADTSGNIGNSSISMRTNEANDYEPAVTILTNIAGAVSVPIDLPRVDAWRRIRSMALPDNLFNPFRNRRSCSKLAGKPSRIDEASSQFLPQRRVGVTASERSQSLSVSSAAVARDVVASIRGEIAPRIQGTLETRALMVCVSRSHWLPPQPPKRDASGFSSVIGNYNPSTFLGASTAKKASSAVPPRSRASARGYDIEGRRSDPDPSDSREEARPRSAVPRLGASSHAARADDDGEPVDLQPIRSLSASGRGGRGSGECSNGRRGRGSQSGNAGRENSTRSPKLEYDDTTSSNFERVDDLYEEIYEDLNDEDDDELDKQIFITESRFSSVGRERLTSAVGHDVPPRNRVPPPMPPRSSIAAAGETLERADGERETTGWRPPRIGRRRPMSVPADCSLLESHRRPDPMAALNARRMKLYTSSAGGGGLRLLAGGALVQEYGASGAVDLQQGRQPKQQATRDVTTAVPSWDRGVSAGVGRPLSNASTEIEGGESHGHEGHQSTAGSRPSSAAFQRWIEARPSARSAVSAVSSARTIGLDDPELVHLQVEMESRRGRTSEATLARMEEHYSAVERKTTDVSRSQKARRGKRGWSKSPRRKSRGGVKRSPLRRPTTARSRRSESKGTTPRSSKGSSRGATGGEEIGGRRKKRPASSWRRRSPNNSRGKVGRRREDAASAWRKAYPSARAFMAEHFPGEDDYQGVSLLEMEQEQECRHVSATLSRAGVWVSHKVLRRALVIPTDRPLEKCLAGLPLPWEGLRDKPFPSLSGARDYGGAMIRPKFSPKRARSPVRKGARKLVVDAGARAGA